MFFYILLAVYFILSLTRINIKTMRGKKLFVFLLLLPMFIVSAFRGISIGTDTASYYRVYNNISYNITYNGLSLISAVRNSRMEPAYVLINYLLGKMGCSYFVMQILLNIFFYVSLGHFIYKYSKQPAFSCFIFYASLSAFSVMNVVRMWLAVAVLINSVEYIKKHDLIRFALIVFIAGMFHYSAFLFTIVYPMSTVKLSMRQVLFILVLAIVFWRTAVPLFTFVTSTVGLYGSYINDERFFEFGNLATRLDLLVNISFFAVIASVSRNRSRESNDMAGDAFLNEFIFLTMLLTLAISVVGLSNNIMGRIVHYFSIFMIVGIPDAVERIKLASNRRITRLLIHLGLLAEFVVIMIFRPDWPRILPYNFFFIQ